MKDGDLVYVAVCTRCGPICVTDSMMIDRDRQAEHRDAAVGEGHVVFSSSIGLTLKKERKS